MTLNIHSILPGMSGDRRFVQRLKRWQKINGSLRNYRRKENRKTQQRRSQVKEMRVNDDRPNCLKLVIWISDESCSRYRSLESPIISLYPTTPISIPHPTISALLSPFNHFGLSHPHIISFILPHLSRLDTSFVSTLFLPGPPLVLIFVSIWHF